MRKNAHCSRCSQLPRRKREYSVDLAQFSVPPGETQVLYLPWLPIPSDISLYSVRTPEVSLLAATPQLLEWLPRDRDSEQHHTCGTAQSLPSDLPLPSPHSSKATAVVASLAFNWQRSSWVWGFFTTGFFPEVPVPSQPLSSSSYRAFHIQEILFKSSHGHGCGRAISQWPCLPCCRAGSEFLVHKLVEKAMAGSPFTNTRRWRANF